MKCQAGETNSVPSMVDAKLPSSLWYWLHSHPRPSVSQSTVLAPSRAEESCPGDDGQLAVLAQVAWAQGALGVPDMWLRL